MSYIFTKGKYRAYIRSFFSNDENNTTKKIRSNSIYFTVLNEYQEDEFGALVRNIGFRLLGIPTNVRIICSGNTVRLMWNDPADIVTNEPAPAIWAGTVVVRKQGLPPTTIDDGEVLVNSTTRNEYSKKEFIDDTSNQNILYYYGIFPYDTKGNCCTGKVISNQGG